MYVRPISTLLLRGMLTPAMRATSPASPLPLLVTGVLADHEHRTAAADDLALLAHGLDRCSDLHSSVTWTYTKGREAQGPGDGRAPTGKSSSQAPEAAFAPEGARSPAVRCQGV